MDADGTREHRMTDLDGADDVSWSGDGGRIVFSRRLELYVLDVQSRTSKRLGDGSTDTDPAWRPTGAGAAASEKPTVAAPTAARPTYTEARYVPGRTAPVPRTTSELLAAETTSTQPTADDPPPVAAAAPTAAVHERSSLSASLHRPSEIRFDPAAVLASAFGCAFLLLLVFPGNLFSNTFEEHYGEILGWFGRKPRVAKTSSSRRWPAIAFMAAATAVLSGFLDPSFGFDGASLVLVASLVGLFALLATIRAGQIAFLNQRTKSRAHIKTFPAALVVAALCVGLSRAVAFVPGYLYGNLTGTATDEPLSTPDKGRAQALNLGAGLLCSFAAWGLWSLVDGPASQPHPSLAIQLADAFLAACFVGGIGSALFSLIPVRWMDGYDVIRHSRRLWLALAAPTAFAFVHLLLQPSEGTSGSIVAPLVLFVAFGAGSVAFWGYFRFRPSPDPGPEPAPDGTTRRRAGSGSWSPA
jgi:hypothetical protein